MLLIAAIGWPESAEANHKSATVSKKRVGVHLKPRPHLRCSPSKENMGTKVLHFLRYLKADQTFQLLAGFLVSRHRDIPRQSASFRRLGLSPAGPFPSQSGF